MKINNDDANTVAFGFFHKPVGSTERVAGFGHIYPAYQIYNCHPCKAKIANGISAACIGSHVVRSCHRRIAVKAAEYLTPL